MSDFFSRVDNFELSTKVNFSFLVYDDNLTITHRSKFLISAFMMIIMNEI